jgi:hypothetical protein
MKRNFRIMCEALGPQRLVCEVTPLDAEKMDQRRRARFAFDGERVQSAIAGVFQMVRNWWAQVLRGKPFAGVKLSAEEEVPVGILTADELGRLLEVADPGTLAYVALGAFAGLRSAELHRLDWSEIDFEDGVIEVPANKAKSARRRPVKMQPVLRAWLEPISKKSGAACFIRKWHLPPPPLCRAAGGHRSMAEERVAPFVRELSPCQVQRRRGAGAGDGPQDNELIFKHYRAVVRESEALRYWNLMPEQPDNVLRLAQLNGELIPKEERRERQEGAQRPYARTHRAGYSKTTCAYAKEYGVGTKIITKWMRMGKPLDDAEAMARLDRGEYTMSVRDHAKLYGVTPWRIKMWRRSAWPLDEPEKVRGYLDFLKAEAAALYGSGKNCVVKVIGLGRKEALHPSRIVTNFPAQTHAKQA